MTRMLAAPALALAIGLLPACGAKTPASPAAAAQSDASAETVIPADVLARLGKGVDDVALVDQTGAPRTWAALNGAPRVVFFGFTHCPEICPTTMATLQAAKDQAGPAAANLRIDFVSIDPARDTPAALAAYFKSFGPSVRGITGDEAAIGKVAKAFRAAYRRSDLGGGDYTMDHTTLVYLLDASGAVRDVSAYSAPPDRVAAQIKRLVSAPAAGG